MPDYLGNIIILLLGTGCIAVIAWDFTRRHWQRRLEKAERNWESTRRGMYTATQTWLNKCFATELVWSNQHKRGTRRFLVLGDGSIQEQRWENMHHWSDEYSCGISIWGWKNHGDPMTKEAADKIIAEHKKAEKARLKAMENQKLREMIEPKLYWSE